MGNEFAKNCNGCRYSRFEFDVFTAMDRDTQVTDGYKTCVHPKNEYEFWIPYLYNCPWKVVE